MQNFNNEAYELLLTDIINDAFYTNTSNRGRIAKIRQCAEVVMRRVLVIPQTQKFTLGHKSVKERVEKINNYILTNAINIINSNGSDSTHTQDLTEKSDSDVNRAVDALFDLYSYLLIAFFEKYTFGTNSSIMNKFSLLPPIIRYKVLTYLYDKCPDNVHVIDRLALATLKSKGKEDAILWVDSNAKHFKGMSSVTSEAKASIFNKLGQEVGQQILDSSGDMYDLCIDKINKVGNDTNRIVYNDFESALPHYKEHGRLSGTTQDEIEFNSIMEFLYLGRKENTAIKSE